MSSTFTLAEIKKALNQHNKDLNNDIKIKIKDGKISFSSSKAESLLLQERMKRGPEKPKTTRKPKKPPVSKGQQKLTTMLKK